MHLGRHQSKEWWKALSNILVYSEELLAIDYKKVNGSGFTYQVYIVTPKGENFIMEAFRNKVDIKNPDTYPLYELALTGDLKKYMRSHPSGEIKPAVMDNAPNSNQNNPYNFPVSSYKPEQVAINAVRPVDAASGCDRKSDCIQEVWTPTLISLLDCSLMKTRKHLAEQTSK